MEPVHWQIRLFKKSRPPSADKLVPQTQVLLAGLGKLDRGLSDWFARDRGYRVVPARRSDDCAALLEGSRIDWDAPTPPRNQPTPAATESLWQAALDLVVQTLQPDWGVCGTTAAIEKLTQASARPRAGWLTYVRLLLDHVARARGGNSAGASPVGLLAMALGFRLLPPITPSRKRRAGTTTSEATSTRVHRGYCSCHGGVCPCN